MANVVWAFRINDTLWAILLCLAMIGTLFLFHFCLKLRAHIGSLPDKQLETFLTETLFVNFLKAFFSFLFLSFRTTKCVIERRVSECDKVEEW